MYILVDEACRLSLEEADDFKAFSLAIAAPRSALPAIAQAVERAGMRLEGGHCWIPQAWLRAADGVPRPAAWQENLDGMIAYAATKGWVDEPTGDVRAHVEWKA